MTSITVCCLLLTFASVSFAQTETATIRGTIIDPQGRVVPEAVVSITRTETGTLSVSKTNAGGVYAFAGLVPGHHRLAVSRPGFKEIATKEFQLSVQEKLEQNFSLEIGSVNETVTVDANTLTINTQDGSVSTVVDRQFAENLPLNGRSFQSLIELTPGVVLTPNTGTQTGQFSINGQRADANYWMVDGVGANIGMSAAGYVGQGLSGSLGATNVFGGTNSLVSVDALEEFRIQTSTYAPEFGRSPGGQISIVTRSGTNQFHGSLFEYLRNEALDANDWFGDNVGLPKPKERQNNFGATLGGPILENHTFFFFSYEGMRLELPETSLTLVPDTNPSDPYSRQFAVPAMQPYLNAYPLPNGPEVLDSNGNHQGVAEFNAIYANPGSLDAFSVRVDHRMGEKVNLFGRYDFSPSHLNQRGGYIGALNSVNYVVSKTLTATFGATWTISPTVTNDSRFNFSQTANYDSLKQDNFGGATPVTSFPFPSPFTTQNSLYEIYVGGLTNGPAVGASGLNLQRQINVVDNVSIQRGAHALKFGVDYRQLFPSVVSAPGVSSKPGFYAGLVVFNDVSSADTGNASLLLDSFTRPVTFLFRNLGAFAQDTWRVFPRLTATFGLRWDVDFSPSTLSGPNFSPVTGFNLDSLSTLALAPPGTSPFHTSFGNIAPRIGLAYQLRRDTRWQTVLRGGLGLFYDLATSESGNIYSDYNYPFGSNYTGSGTFPAVLPVLPVVPPNASNGGWLYALDPNLKQPYTLEWNVAIEQALGSQQTLTASYIGAAGRRLIMTTSFLNPNPNFAQANLVSNGGLSNYDALQLQFQRRLAHGLQILCAYTWSHSLDTGSEGQSSLAGVNSTVNYGNSDFDIRHTMSAALTYDIPASVSNRFAKFLLRGWSLDNIFQAHSASPVDVAYDFATLALGQAGQFAAPVRPDVVPGQPLYLYGSQYPGGKAINPAAFTPPPLAPAGCVAGVDFPCAPTRPGTLHRNSLRGFGLYQWDFAAHREFHVHESLKMEFRAEMFNLLNHPNFGPPGSDLGSPPPNGNPQFGVSTQMLGQSLAGGNFGTGGLDPLYQIGGPRSIQLALKLHF
jgi:hypothetical protein